MLLLFETCSSEIPPDMQKNDIDNFAFAQMLTECDFTSIDHFHLILLNSFKQEDKNNIIRSVLVQNTSCDRLSRPRDSLDDNAKKCQQLVVRIHMQTHTE